MTQSFGPTSTTDDVLDGISLLGKRVLVTGVSAGLGVETVRALVAHGAQVIGTARDLEKAQRATAQVREDATAGNGSFELIQLDLADFASVRACADALNAKGVPFDLVIANAGVMHTPFGHTKDGFETQFGTNHLGHFVLVNRIAPLMREGARLVSLSSLGHRFSDVDLEDPNFEHNDYEPWAAYGRSKTANALFALAFDNRHRDRGVRGVSVHPGAIRTELSRHMSAEMLQGMIEQIDRGSAEQGLPGFTMKTIPQGAATSLWAGVTAPAELIGGKYCEDCHVAVPLPDDQPQTMRTPGVRDYARDPVRAEALWRLSEKLVGEQF